MWYMTEQILLYMEVMKAPQNTPWQVKVSGSGWKQVDNRDKLTWLCWCRRVERIACCPDAVSGSTTWWSSSPAEKPKQTQPVNFPPTNKNPIFRSDWVMCVWVPQQLWSTSGCHTVLPTSARPPYSKKAQRSRRTRCCWSWWEPEQTQKLFLLY